jgi:hypothetical protein
MIKMKGKIITDIRKYKERARKHQQEELAMLYNKPETIDFLDGDKLNMYSFRAIPKSLMSYGLSMAALAVYPVFCSKADFEEDKTFQISQKNIALLAGVSENAVREATKELEEARLLSREKITKGSRHFYIYEVAFIRKPMLEQKEHKGNTIYFYTCIIDNGIWAKLKPRAKALYLAMRATARQDLEEYSLIMNAETGESYEWQEYDDYIRNRKWDICLLSLSEMCRIAGIERSNIYVVLAELERYKLIERIGKWTKVYLKPRRLLKH